MSINLNSNPTMPGGPRHLGHGRLLAALGGAALLIAVAGAGLWARAGTDESSPATESALSLPSLNTAAPASIAGVSANAARVGKAQDVVWIYVVGSQAAAAELLNAAAGVPGSPSQVVVAASQAEADFYSSAFVAHNDLRAAAGEPRVKVLLLGEFAAAD
ncbi:MAG: hypothetical protein C0506_14635 [Anaerolinea sp.]|nr:hypothetical protein [Anaerolinea sp.]